MCTRRVAETTCARQVRFLQSLSGGTTLGACGRRFRRRDEATLGGDECVGDTSLVPWRKQGDASVR